MKNLTTYIETVLNVLQTANATYRIIRTIYMHVLSIWHNL